MVNQICHFSYAGRCRASPRFEVWTEARSQRLGVVCGRHVASLLTNVLAHIDVLVTAYVGPGKHRSPSD